MPRFEQLWSRYISGSLTRQEITELLGLLDMHKNEALAGIDVMMNKGVALHGTSEDEEAILKVIQERINIASGRPVIHRVHLLQTAWVRYAAAILIIICSGIYFYSNNKNASSHTVIQSVPDITPPSLTLATITLSDGKIITVDSVPTGVFAREGNIAIEKTIEGKINYKGTSTGEVLYNTVSVPRGSKTGNVTLSDGTTVFLNAESSLTYPVAFTGKERKVTIIGEAYFDIAKNKLQPFIVHTERNDITVLGTSFNVYTYPNEKEKISLVQGSVKINQMLVQPGQAFVDNRVVTTNISQDIAWKNGIFNFHKLSLQQVMLQLSRWYDLKITYESRPAIIVGGKMGRDLSLQQVLKILAGMGLHYELKGRALIIK
jgi:transmembrane sensor